MSNLWDVPQYLIMAFSLALDAPAEKASRVSYTSPPQASVASKTAGPQGVPGEDFWLRAVKTAAAHSDILKVYGSRIFVTTSGRYYVPAAGERSEILALRRNPDVSARVLAAATKTLREDLQARTHHEPTRGALLVAHMAGENAAVRYMHAYVHDSEIIAAQAVPALAALLGDERNLTIAQLDARLSRAARPLATEVASETRGTGLRGTLTKPEGKVSGQVASR